MTTLQAPTRWKLPFDITMACVVPMLPWADLLSLSLVNRELRTRIRSEYAGAIVKKTDERIDWVRDAHNVHLLEHKVARMARMLSMDRARFAELQELRFASAHDGSRTWWHVMRDMSTKVKRLTAQVTDQRRKLRDTAWRVHEINDLQRKIAEWEDENAELLETIAVYEAERGDV